MHEILEILYENAKATPSEIAALLGRSEEEVAREIKEMEDAGIIRKYITLINWEKLDKSVVFAVLELKVALQRKTGYDAVAERIARFSEVESVRLAPEALADLRLAEEFLLPPCSGPVHQCCSPQAPQFCRMGLPP